jgi:hypothetical protein
MLMLKRRLYYIYTIYLPYTAFYWQLSAYMLHSS